MTFFDPDRDWTWQEWALAIGLATGLVVFGVIFYGQSVGRLIVRCLLFWRWW